MSGPLALPQVRCLTISVRTCPPFSIVDPPLPPYSQGNFLRSLPGRSPSALCRLTALDLASNGLDDLPHGGRRDEGGTREQ